MWAGRIQLAVVLSHELIDLPFRNRPLVSLCEATHCKSARALHTRFDAAAVSCDGFNRG